MRSILIAALAAAPLPALAHAILMDSTPPAAATIPPGQTHLKLRYNSRIDQARSRLELRLPGQPPAALKLTPSTPETLEADATLKPGPITLRWQVLAVDGHITRGDVPLTVKAP